MHIHHPGIAKRWDKEGGTPEHLPEHVQEHADGGYVCMSCGGRVGEDGMSEGGEMEEHESPEEEAAESEQHEASEQLSSFANAVLRRR